MATATRERLTALEEKLLGKELVVGAGSVNFVRHEAAEFFRK